MLQSGIGVKALQKTSAEMIVLALLEERSRHGYELAKLIQNRSEGRLEFHVASLYRLQGKGWVGGRRVERPNERRRRYYRLTPRGRKVLALQRRSWREFLEILNRVAQFRSA